MYGNKFCGQYPLRVCRNQRIHIYKTCKSIAMRGKCSMGWFFGLKLNLIKNAELPNTYYYGFYSILGLIHKSATTKSS